MKTPLTVVKIVSTPTINAWSQAYHAGNVTAVVALVQKPIEQTAEGEEFEQELSLAALGKDVLGSLEAEYFTLETKTLQSIKRAVETTVEKIPEAISVSLCVTVLINNILYLYIYGQGKILMKRQTKVGVLLQQTQENKLGSGSGYIENGDIVILETKDFIDTVPDDMLLPCLEENKITEMVDAISPALHNHQNGGAAALAFSYQEETPAFFDGHSNEQPKKTFQIKEPFIMSQHKDVLDKKEENEQSTIIEELPLEHTTISDEPEVMNEQHLHANTIRMTEEIPPQRKRTSGFSHKRKLLLTIALVILLVFGASVYIAITKQKQAQVDALYTLTITPAQQKYNEGQSLLDVNKNLARQDFQQSHDMLAGSESKFPANSTQQQNIIALEKKINDALSGVAITNAIITKQVDASVSPLLSVVSKHTEATAFTQDSKFVYLATTDGILSVTKASSIVKTLVKNTGDFKTPGGLDTYLGNFYLLDTGAGILKYVPSGNSFSKSNYFPSGVTPDLSKAKSMTIDGSIWIVTSDGQVSKYTRGKKDDFSIKNLDKPLSNASQIVTTVDDTNVYVLDNGNSRIVVFDKNGTYVSQYSSDALQAAKAMDVLEKDKKIYILSNNNFYEINL